MNESQWVYGRGHLGFCLPQLWRLKISGCVYVHLCVYIYTCIAYTTICLYARLLSWCKSSLAYLISIVLTRLHFFIRLHYWFPGNHSTQFNKFWLSTYCVLGTAAALQMPSLKGMKSSKKRQVHQLIWIIAKWLKRRRGRERDPVPLKKYKKVQEGDFSWILKNRWECNKQRVQEGYRAVQGEVRKYSYEQRC